MRRTSSGSCAANILLLFVICCLWCHIQPAAGGKCSGAWAIHACAGGNGKRSDVDEDRVQATDLRADGGERPDIQDAREGERIRGGGGGREGERREGGGREGGGRDIDGYRGSREGDDDLRSDFNDLRRQLSDEVELVDIGNHRRHSLRSAELDSAISRLRSLLGTTDLDVDGRGEAEEKREGRHGEEEEEEPQRRTDTDTDTDTDRRYVVKESLTMLRRILDDIDRRLDAPPTHHSVSKNKGHVAADDTEDSYYSIEKRAVDQ